MPCLRTPMEAMPSSMSNRSMPRFQPAALDVPVHVLCSTSVPGVMHEQRDVNGTGPRRPT